MNTEGLYLYCLRKKTDIPFSSSIKGIDEKQGVFIFAYKDLEAVISKVSLEEFGSEAIQIRAQNDLKWIKEKAVIHESVIEEVMKNNGETVNVIPMKFGTIFKEEKNLKQTLNRHYEQFKVTLEKLKGKQEWSIKAYFVDKKKFEQVIKEKSKIIKEKEKEITNLPEGMAYFMENELKELFSKETDAELKKIRREIFEKFKIYAEEAKEGKILEKELTGRPEPMILNASYLIKKEKLEDFKTEIKETNEQLSSKGLGLEYSGPWPPYNFVS